MNYKEEHDIWILKYLTYYIQSWGMNKGQIFESIEGELRDVYMLHYYEGA